MLVSLFEVYDPYTYGGSLSLNWSTLLFFMMFFILSFWFLGNNFNLTWSLLINYMNLEFSVFYSSRYLMKGGVFLFSIFYVFILLVNVLGLIPYSFSNSSHLVFSLSLGLPVWLGIVLFGWLNFTRNFLSHLVPHGTPTLLIPLMVIIELISNLIRPCSLAVRLMSNMISGHLLMSLLGGCGLYAVCGQLFLFFFEVFVCFIQSYVFSALMALYAGEI